MKCLTCDGKGIISNDMYHPSVVCVHCKGSGLEKEKDIGEVMNTCKTCEEVTTAMDMKVGDWVDYKWLGGMFCTHRIVELGDDDVIVEASEDKEDPAYRRRVPRKWCDWGECRNSAHEYETVDHPKHYTFGKFEVIDVIEDWGLDKDYHLGNTIKYIARAKHKGEELENLKKARWYLNRKIAQLEK